MDLEEEITQILASLLEVASVYPSTCPYKIHKREFVVRRNGPREGMKTLIRGPGYNSLLGALGRAYPWEVGGLSHKLAEQKTFCRREERSEGSEEG